MIPPDLHFAHPFALLFAAAIFGIILLYVILFLYRQKVLKSLNLDTDHPRSALFHRVKVIFLCLAWALAILAIMWPVGNAHYPETKAITYGARKVIFLVDVSDSMSVQDTRIGLSRLDHAKEIVDDLAAKLAGRNLALNSFTSDLLPMVPPTMDALFVRLMVNRLRINEGGVPGTDFLRSLEELKKSLGDKQATIVLLSDGGDTEWEALSGRQKETRLQQIADVFKEIPIITVGVGSEKPVTIPKISFDGKPVTTKLEPEILQALGPYFAANQYSTIGLSNEIAQLIDREVGEAAQGAGTQVVYDQYFQIPLFFSLLCLLAALALPETRKRTVLLTTLMIFPLWGGDIETANVYADTGFLTQAEELYNKLLAKPLEVWQQDIIYYNLGTLYLKQGLWDEAIEEFIKISGDDSSPDFIPKVQNNLAQAILGKAQGLDPEPALLLLSINQENSPLFQEVWDSLPPSPARNALLTALQKNQSPELQNLRGYPLKLAKLSTNLSGVNRKIALITALAAVNREEKAAQSPEAVRILKKALEEQKRSHDLTYLVELFKFYGTIAPEITNLLRDQQTEAIQTAEKFIPAAIAMQNTNCQKSTWKHVFPSFGQGLQIAEHSNHLLQNKEPLWIVEHYQSETIQLWTFSLEYLEVAESAAAPDEMKAIASEDVQQLIQTVIEMDLQDEKTEQTVPDVQQVKRPW